MLETDEDAGEHIDPAEEKALHAFMTSCAESVEHQIDPIDQPDAFARQVRSLVSGILLRSQKLKVA